MAQEVSDQDLGDAILQSVEHGSFPQSEDVASATVPSTSLPKLLDTIQKAREDTKNEIRKVSKEAGSDVDGWIKQARKLQSDIKRSQETAHEIVQQAEAGKQHTANVQDAASKVSFLYSEISYNESLVRVVEQLKDISTLLESAQDAAVNGHVMHALDRLEDTDGALKQLGAFGNTRVVGVLKNKASQLRNAIAENTAELWNGLLVVDAAEKRITLRDEIVREGPIGVSTVVEAMEKLGKLDGFISRLCREFDNVILAPRLVSIADEAPSSIEIEGDDIRIDGPVSDTSVKATLEDVQAIAEYLSTRLPPSIAVPLSRKLLPILNKRLITNWLLPAVPLSTDGVLPFQETLSLVLGLAEYFDELEWTGQNHLREWVDNSAQIWLSRRKEVAIARVRSILPRRIEDKKTVERVETQMVSKGDAVLDGQEDQDEDWGDAWGEEEENPAAPAPDVEEEDISAWGVEEDEPQEDPKQEKKVVSEDQEEDWGADWGDDEETKPAAAPPAPSKPTEPTRPNGKVSAPQTQKSAREKEITLRETYTVTAIPDSIMEIIIQAVSDVGTLNQPDLSKAMIAPASAGLYAIPGHLLAMYRATAATYYSKDPAANMLIYNDCTRLTDRLRIFLQEQMEHDKTTTLPLQLRPSSRLKLDNDINAIQVFGKRAYGREMESQRTILRDFLDEASGFGGCTTAQYATECDNAVAMTVDRIGEVKRQWQNVLSHSALQQSLGSLVSTAITKFINDVEDLADIPEDESGKLHSYCKSFSSLSSFFQQENEQGEVKDATYVYVKNWFKLQYLGEILDSSLADIKFMWTESDLKFEMTADEVVDLINALFAESEHRRKAINEIRRLSRG
ncbi:hypothetical protein BDV96DRAFT_525147 [Lophiotrema nucula]|uniref:ZW10 C-terminal helical domain-containing protein n=1 Tax=Lophiotrema nucula TaxID=690887 RepID=A0A6A5Z002_9PLEO|nr:hypothetical protein BDV96DRAFT_525147 [Lophiotrema nucula]